MKVAGKLVRTSVHYSLRQNIATRTYGIHLAQLNSVCGGDWGNAVNCDVHTRTTMTKKATTAPRPVQMNYDTLLFRIPRLGWNNVSSSWTA